jgi:hypothetical protein
MWKISFYFAKVFTTNGKWKIMSNNEHFFAIKKDKNRNDAYE